MLSCDVVCGRVLSCVLVDRRVLLCVVVCSYVLSCVVLLYFIIFDILLRLVVFRHLPGSFVAFNCFSCCMLRFFVVCLRTVEVLNSEHFLSVGNLGGSEPCLKGV